MRKLVLVALLAILVTGGIAAVYRGPIHPAGEDANAAAKTDRTKPHVMFDPSEYASDGKPAPEPFLKAFHLDLAYWRSRLLPATRPEPSSPAVNKRETPPRVSQTETAIPKPAPTVLRTTTQPQPQDLPELLTSADTDGLMSDAFLMTGIAPALATQTALRTGTFAGALSPAGQQFRANGNLDQNLTSSAPSYSLSKIFSISLISRLTQEQPSGTEAIPRAYLKPFWSRYFTLSREVSILPSPPDDNASQFPDVQSFPDPFLAYPLAPSDLHSSLFPMPLRDANLGFPPDAVPEPRTFILCSLALTFLLWRRSRPV